MLIAPGGNYVPVDEGKGDKQHQNKNFLELPVPEFGGGGNRN